MKKIFIMIAASVVIISGIVFSAMYIIGDRLIQESISNDMLSSDYIQQKQDDTSGQGKEKPAERQVEAASPVPEPDPSKVPDNNSPVRKPAEEKKVSDKSSEEAIKITAGRINAVKNGVAPADKISAAALAIKRLSPGDISKLKGFMADGLTGEEKEKAKQIVYSRFTEEEIDKIKSMYAKYLK